MCWVHGRKEAVDLRIYMDVCCLSRPFDDMSNDRIFLEAEAVLSIISRCEDGEWTLVTSWAVDYELSRLPDLDRLGQIQTLLGAATEKIKLTKRAEQLAAQFKKRGLKDFDSMHLALAEADGADVFLTTDDRLLKKVLKSGILKILVANPASWLLEVSKR
jgi:predicted nucleic acid-binding protein